MTTTTRKSLKEYLALEYSFNVIADSDGGYVILFPDLPGCMSQVESVEEIPSVAEEIRRLWMESEYEMGHDIPLPSYADDYSGKFIARLPRSLHRSLVEAAAREGVSLNQHVVALLSRGDAQARLEREVRDLASQAATSAARATAEVMESMRVSGFDAVLSQSMRGASWVVTPSISTKAIQAALSAAAYVPFAVGLAGGEYWRPTVANRVLGRGSVMAGAKLPGMGEVRESESGGRLSMDAPDFKTAEGQAQQADVGELLEAA